MDWRERIESDPQTLHGEPHVRGTAIPVSEVLEELTAHLDFHDVLKSHPGLSEDDVRACLSWAAHAERVPASVVLVLAEPVEGKSKLLASWLEEARAIATSGRTAGTGAAPVPHREDVVVVDAAGHRVLLIHLSDEHRETTGQRSAEMDAAWKRVGTELTQLLRAMPAPTVEAAETAAPTSPPAEGEPASQEPTVYDFLLLGPNVGEDSDFERQRGPRRELPEWDI